MAIRYFLFMGRPPNLPRFSQTTNSAQQILNQTTIQNNENNQFECLFNYTEKQGRSIACSSFSVCLYFLKNLNFTFKKTLQIKKNLSKISQNQSIYISIYFLVYCIQYIPTLISPPSTLPNTPRPPEHSSSTAFQKRAGLPSISTDTYFIKHIYFSAFL